MQQLLGSWKEIAVYLNRGVRTTQRWEKQNALPVHRVGKSTKSPVYRFEIDAWLGTHAGAVRHSVKYWFDRKPVIWTEMRLSDNEPFALQCAN